MERLEEIQQRHRKEKKELQAKIQALKKSATKGDKKKKREVAEEIAKLELELEKKHDEELSEFSSASQLESVTVELEKMNTSESVKAPEPVSNSQSLHRVSKAQKRRERKAIEIRERERRISEQEAENLHGARYLETKTINEILKARTLMINEIPSDGNCLYKAVDEELTRVTKAGKGVEELRKLAARVMRTRKDDLLPFLVHPESGDTYTDDEYKEYCDAVEKTAAWGGHVELVALADGLQCCIEVIQSTGNNVKVGDSGPLLLVTYHRHMYGLGEHYNAVKQYQEEQESL